MKARTLVDCIITLAITLASGFANTTTSVAAEPSPGSLVRGIKVLPDNVPDCSSLESIVQSVTRGCKTNDEKAIAIYNFMRLTHYHRAYPNEPGGIPVLKEINCYGWSLCGGLHAEQSALWRAMGWDWRFVGWPGHTTVEAFYDGRWHYLDVFLKFYAWMPDPKDPTRRTIAGQDDLAANPDELVLGAFVMDPARRVVYAKGNEFDLFGSKANWQAPAFLTCGDDLMGVVAGVRQRNRVGAEPGWSGMKHDTGNYSADVNLAPGFALTNTWDATEGAWYWNGSQIPPCHTCGDKEIRNSPEKGPVVEPYLGPDWKAESYANGQLLFRPDLSSAICLNSFASMENVKCTENGLVPMEAGQPGRVTVLLKSPYIMTQATGSATGVDLFEVSVDGGTSWKPTNLNDFGSSVGGKVEALVRLTFGTRLNSLTLQATVQNNPFALPFLSPGRNTVTVSVADPAALGENRLVVTYAYRIGSRRKSYEELFVEGKEISRAHDASWNDSPVVVQKSFAASDLPARFTIDVPTPKGDFPVYPRMLFVRREVLTPAQQSIPLPAGSRSPQLNPGDELKTLPNPLLTGIAPPPARPKGPVTTRVIPLSAGRFFDKSGDVVTSDFLKWPKAQGESVPSLVYLLIDDLPDGPAADDLAAARLVIPVARGHAQAPTKLGLVALRANPSEKQPFDFSQLGEVLTTGIVPTLADNAPSWSPENPQEVSFDITRYLRARQLQQKAHHGFALRVIPDRNIDDGWTVRVHLPQNPKPRLEIDSYVK